MIFVSGFAPLIRGQGVNQVTGVGSRWWLGLLGMKLRDFEVAIIELAAEGVVLTVPNVVVRLKVSPEEARKWLDALSESHKLELDFNDEGVVFYRVRGLTVKSRPAKSDESGLDKALSLGNKGLSAAALALAGRDDQPPRRALAKDEQKSLVLGFLLGLIPGLGLFYAAPLRAAAVVTVVIAVVMTVVGWFGWIPIIGPLIGGALFTMFALASALLGLLYAAAYNRNGRRTMLSDKVSPDKRLPL